MKAFRIKSALGIFFLVALFLLLSRNHGRDGNNVTLPVNFFVADSFWAGQKTAANSDRSLATEKGHVYAALVPHHLVAGKIISGVFEKLKAQDVKKVIIISPNHYEAGAANFQANFTNWQTPFGLVEGKALIPELPEAAPKTMANEHGTAGLLPYIAYYAPKAKVFSVIVKYRSPDRELEMLAEKIVKALDKDTVLVASVDFSHYLPLEVADRRDELTRQLLLELREKPLYTLNNDYLDSPGTLAVMMKVCKKLGVKNFSITGHSNSATILNNPYISSTTSHFAGVCEERQ
jgi:hypothetical protein